ncbi:UDP-glucose dehydrogenase family protein [Amycolatopsis suaedae]|uniref:UDP-glucose 6-dehydrogenase n=1 Tax=Amycolatopsis suaedae TaxID=2510978 RepID=A0A4Q7J0W9_9PSEU|nr:UDP-glucose/GDP-mannose dehydrogenase family protein [Amycolatopsis suaedae]RZQ60222.1 UDP-glucose/GDP-mannose dehydrogenase family protein [Amycolatopsis suaedae]
MSAVGVVGAGYVGLTTAACLAHLGHRVTCVDIDKSKVDDLGRGEVRIAEPGLPELVRAGLEGGELGFTTDLEPLRDTTVVLLCLPTPRAADGDADTRVVDAVLDRLEDLLPAGAVVVTKSTVPVGTAAAIGRRGLRAVSNPEFLREGHAVEDFLNPDRIVIGSADEAAGDAVAALYRRLVAPVVRTDPASAELAKYASNAFLATKLSYVNGLAQLCERLGADVTEVTRTMGLDARIGPDFLAPGPGWGGSCLPKDTSALLRAAAGAGVEFDVLRAAVRTNERQGERVAAAVREAVGGPLSGARVGLLGLAFKAGTGDLRDSPALAVAAKLADGGAVLTGYDPAVDPAELDGSRVQVTDDPYLVAKDAEALVVLTDWPQFRDLDWARMAALAERAVVVDTRNLLDPALLRARGFRRYGTGTRPE